MSLHSNVPLGADGLPSGPFPPLSADSIGAHEHGYQPSGLGEEMDRCGCGKRRGEPEEEKSPAASLTIRDLVAQSYGTAKAKGWYEKEDALLALLRKVADDVPPFQTKAGQFTDAERATARAALADGVSKLPERMMLMVSEIAEALEEHRAGRAPTEVYYVGIMGSSGVRMPYAPDTLPGHKPEGIPVELADVVIRVADACGRYGIDLEAALRLKLAFNAGRSHRHGNKVC